MTLAGAGGLFLFIAICAAAMTGFGLWRLAATEAVPGDAKQDFQILPRTTPTAALLDHAADPDAPTTPVTTSPRKPESITPSPSQTATPIPRPLAPQRSEKTGEGQKS